MGCRSVLARFTLGVALCACLHPAWAGRLFSSVKARAPDLEAARDASLPPDAQLQSAGARIGAVRIVSRNLFDASVQDDSTAFSRLANRLHIATRTNTIEDQLLFRTGDLYQPGLLAESARILRDTRYLRDASVRPVGDLAVQTQKSF